MVYIMQKQQKKIISSIQKMYNKTTITQLGTCQVVIKHKNNKKSCQFFVVPGDGQALLGLPDTDVLNIININIDSIDAEVVKNKECHVNTKTLQRSNAE